MCSAVNGDVFLHQRQYTKLFRPIHSVIMQIRCRTIFMLPILKLRICTLQHIFFEYLIWQLFLVSLFSSYFHSHPAVIKPTLPQEQIVVLKTFGTCVTINRLIIQTNLFLNKIVFSFVPKYMSNCDNNDGTYKPEAPRGGKIFFTLK
jgi:hypothetical protein